METNQTFINQFVDDNYEAILDRLATKMQEASEIPVVDYNSLKHQAVLMQYVWEGVHQIQAVSPNSYLADALALVTAAVNRANAALQDIEDANAAICDAEELRALAETARANAENARAAAEELRAAAEQARASAENARALAETGRVNAETARANAETARSGWFNTFKATVESWYSSPDDGTGILQIWNAFKSSADTWMSLAQSAWNSFFGATAESEGGVRKIWSTWLASAQSAYQSLTNSMNAAETARADAETARANAEAARANAETARANAETARDNAETTRGTNEQTRQTNEGTRQTSEGQRSAAEGLRALAELDREDAEDDREDAETARQSAYNTLMQNLQALYQEMLSRNNHPAQFGQDGYIYQWDVTLEQYVRTEHFWKQFSSFHISKEFASISAMNAYDPTNLPQGEYALEVSDFVLIKSNPEDPDNSKLYSYSGENVDNDPDFERFHYLGDFSGAQGFQGKTPQLSIGTVLAGNPGTQPSVSLTADGQDSNGNPRFLVNFTIPRGADGRGISSLTQQTRSNVSGGENVWRATFSDGATADLIVLNGEQGANAGIGEATATVDNGVGTPSVTINTGGTNANRIFSFAFHNLKGVTFTPSVDANGNLSWTNDGGLTNPTSFNIISAIPLATQLQQGLMSAADKEKLDNSLPLASNQVSALTAANALAQDSGKTVFWGSQDNDGKWTLQKMSPEELQKLAYEYMKSSSILSEYASLLGVGNPNETLNISLLQEGGNNEDLVGIVIKVIDAFDNSILYQAIWQGNVISTELPTGMHVIVSVSNVIGYISDVYEESHLTQFGVKDVSFSFEDAGVGAYIESSDHLLYTASRWNTAKTANAVVLLLDTHKYRIAPINPALHCCEYTNSINPQSYVTCVCVEDTELGPSEAGGAKLDRDFDGKLYTEQWLAYYDAIGKSTDISYCGVYCKYYTFPDGKKGYWGSAGQLLEIALNLTAIQTCFSRLNISDFQTGYSSSYGGAPYGSKTTWSIYVPTHGMSAYRYGHYNYGNSKKSMVIADYE